MKQVQDDCALQQVQDDRAMKQVQDDSFKLKFYLILIVHCLNFIISISY